MKIGRAVVENPRKTTKRPGRTHGQRQLRAPTLTTNSLRFVSLRSACFARYTRFNLFASDKTSFICLGK